MISARATTSASWRVRYRSTSTTPLTPGNNAGQGERPETDILRSCVFLHSSRFFVRAPLVVRVRRTFIAAKEKRQATQYVLSAHRTTLKELPLMPLRNPSVAAGRETADTRSATVPPCRKRHSRLYKTQAFLRGEKPQTI